MDSTDKLQYAIAERFFRLCGNIEAMKEDDDYMTDSMKLKYIIDKAEEYQREINILRAHGGEFPDGRSSEERYHDSTGHWPVDF